MHSGIDPTLYICPDTCSCWLESAMIGVSESSCQAPCHVWVGGAGAYTGHGHSAASERREYECIDSVRELFGFGEAISTEEPIIVVCSKVVVGGCGYTVYRYILIVSKLS